MSQPHLPNYIILATLNKPNGIILAVAHSAAVYLLKNSDLLKHMTHLSSLHGDLNNCPLKQLSSKFSSGHSMSWGSILKNQLWGLGLLQISLPHTPLEEGISTFPAGKWDHGQVGKSPSWTLSKRCPAVRVLPFEVREEKTTCSKSNASR